MIWTRTLLKKKGESGRWRKEQMTSVKGRLSQMEGAPSTPAGGVRRWLRQVALGGGKGGGEERRASRRGTELQDNKKLWISYPDYDLSEARSLRVGLSRRVT